MIKKATFACSSISTQTVATITDTFHTTLTCPITVCLKVRTTFDMSIGNTTSLANIGGRARGRTNKLWIADQSILECLAWCVVEVEPVNGATGPRVSDAKMESIGARRVNDIRYSLKNSWWTLLLKSRSSCFCSCSKKWNIIIIYLFGYSLRQCCQCYICTGQNSY